MIRWVSVACHLFFLFGTHLTPAQDLQFYREDITFYLDGETARTDARYFFCNVGADDIKARLFYPFPGNDLELLDSLVVLETGSGSALPYHRSGSGIFFEISVPSYSQATYRVFFKQAARDNHFRYILTSTSAWGRPFESAVYRLHVPAEIIIDSLNMIPDSVYLEGDLRIYLWARTNFMPDRDFEVFFRQEK